MTESSLDGIVILGVPRSGTTLLRRLLSWHPEVHCGGETFLLTAGGRFLRADTIVDAIDYGVLGGLGAAGVAPETVIGDLRGLILGYFRKLAGDAGKRVWASKTALDSFYVPEIERLLAGHVRFVCLVRHGLDVALSLRDLCDANEVYLREIHDYIVRYPRPLVAFAHIWKDLTNSLLDLADRHPETARVVRYEDLVREPTASLASLTEFLDISSGHNLLEGLSRDRPSGLGDWKTYSSTRVENNSVERWRSLSGANISRLAPIVNATLERCGYPSVSFDPLPSSNEAMRRYEIAMSLNASRSRAKSRSES